ncbi:MarR family transcriptional regulator [Actinoplanes sp. M2I2]|uniref:MarR family winged helix-turn-helix transcriptional regulator n=1 Tax=Actinoplanes sp. M2I2 TaxID=1734444 RepID=UPI002021CA82|nr:MarR family transcriptional regulator [Actinoplanes sp. M2I2]
MEEVRRDVVDLLRLYSIEAQRVAHEFAGRHGLHFTDLQALIAVMHAERRGTPLTPGRLGEAIGLSSGATTAVIDRLERAGHLMRTRESTDRRVVHLRYGEPGMELAVAFFRPLGVRSQAVMDGFSPDELVTVRRFLDGMLEAITERHQELRTEAPGRTAAGNPQE